MAGRPETNDTTAGRALERTARWLACFGGLILVAMALITVVSIVGRAFVFAGLGPIKGDFELIEIGCAVAVFAFLPWCHLNRGHVTVDIFMSRAPRGLWALTTVIGDLVVLAIAVIVAWRLALGLGEKIAYGETTFILGLPLWYGYALAMIGAVLFCVVAIFVAWRNATAPVGSGRCP